MAAFEEIRRYLKAHAISQATLAREIGVSDRMLRAVLTGRVRMTAELYLSICEALDVSVETFYPSKN